MKEVIYDFEEFKAKVDTSIPVHHEGIRECIDKQGIFYRITFRMYAIDKDTGHILIFEAYKRTTIMEEKQHREDYLSFVEKFAKPLQSTEGKWMP